MKNIFIKAVLCFSVGTFFSCEDEILNDKVPLDSRSEEVFYKTESDAMEALTAVYDVLQWNTTEGQYGFHPLQMIMDIASDDAYAGGASRSDAPAIIEIDKHNISVNNIHVYGMWYKQYIGIYKANILLQSMDDIEADEEFKKRVTAEARFLRAYFYFDLVRLFENVPLMTEVVSPDQVSQLSQAQPSEVYNQIANDLLESIPDLPTEIQNDGRISAWAAKSLLPRVYLFYNGVYGGNLQAGNTTIDGGTARQLLDDVIDNSGHDLLDDYEQLFLPEGELGVESVFEVQYSNVFPWYDWGYIQGGEGNIGVQMQGPRIKDPGSEDYLAGWSFNTVTEDLYTAYEAGDPRRELSIITMNDFNGDITTGYQHTGYFSKKYTTKKEYTPVEGQTEHNWGNNYHAIRFADVLLMAAELHVLTGGGRAKEYLDRVRARVGMDGITPTLENIYHERRVELALEGHRYWDLLRRGVEMANNEITISGEIGSDYLGDPVEFDITFNPATGGFFPVPQQEIDLFGGVISQNDGY